MRRKGGLFPADEHAEELLGQCKEGKEVLIIVRRARSAANHRHFFAILHNAVNQLREHERDGMPAIHDEDDLLEAVKYAVGHVRLQVKLDGDLVTVPRSINFASLEEGAFQRFKDRALYVLGKLLGCDPTQLEPRQ